MPVKHKSNRRAVEAEIEALIRREVTEKAVEYERIIQEEFRKPKHGRLYAAGVTPTKADGRAGRRFRTHRASAPGEAPAINTGALRKGVGREISKISKGRYRAVIGMKVGSGRHNIALWLEFGTRRIKPRPAWRPALMILQQRMAARRAR